MHCVVLYCILFYFIVMVGLDWTGFHYIALHCMDCIVLQCIVLYCIALYCIVLYCIGLDWTVGGSTRAYMVCFLPYTLGGKLHDVLSAGPSSEQQCSIYTRHGQLKT